MGYSTSIRSHYAPCKCKMPPRYEYIKYDLSNVFNWFDPALKELRCHLTISDRSFLVDPAAPNATKFSHSLFEGTCRDPFP
jgi:hypothetical protein